MKRVLDQQNEERRLQKLEEKYSNNQFMKVWIDKSENEEQKRNEKETHHKEQLKEIQSFQKM